MANSYTPTLTKIDPEDLSSIDLRKEATAGRECDCYRSDVKVSSNAADVIEIVYFPEADRAGLAAGSDAQWTDASSAADALRRFMRNDMSV